MSTPEEHGYFKPDYMKRSLKTTNTPLNASVLESSKEPLNASVLESFKAPLETDNDVISKDFTIKFARIDTYKPSSTEEDDVWTIPSSSSSESEEEYIYEYTSDDEHTKAIVFG